MRTLFCLILSSTLAASACTYAVPITGAVVATTYNSKQRMTKEKLQQTPSQVSAIYSLPRWQRTIADVLHVTVRSLMARSSPGREKTCGKMRSAARTMSEPT